ncbi:MAG TPA: MATE family efflux transporter, partial [Kofleriaceae bacterium]|nr:MATE family efflux transporter [Kofleriaceae bacterium]
MRPGLTGELRALVALAVPLAVGQLGMQLMGLVDTAMLGRFTKAALAGSGVANGLMLPIAVLGMGIVMGLDTLIPQAVGAGNPARVRLLLARGLRVAIVVGVPLSAIAALTPPILHLARVDPDITAAATIYLYWRLPGMIPMLLFAALRSYLQAHHITRPIVIAVIAGNVVNAIADAILIYGDGALSAVGLPAIGLPAFGVAGAAIASSCTMILACAIIALAVRAHLRAQPRTGGLPETGPDPTADIFRLGVPVGLQLAAEVGLFALTGILAGRLGKVPAAAHQVSLSLVSFTFSVAV